MLLDEIPSLKMSDTGESALVLMDQYRVSHLPIVENGEFIGLITDEDIVSVDHPADPISTYHLNLFAPHVLHEQHIMDISELMASMSLTVIPVLNDQKEYMGCISLSELLVNLAKEAGLDQPGAIIILTMTVNDYSLAEISRIIEESGAKVVTLFVSSNPDTMKLDVSIKVNTKDPIPVIRALERYDYQVSVSFQEDKTEDSFYRDRYEEFMRYLNT